MRKWVDTYLTELAVEDSRVRLLIADVGDFPKFSSCHPDKFINVGVSESNCIGVAAGMANEGLKVFVYGVSSFFMYRAYEQFRYSVSYWRRNVTFIGVGFGWKYFNIGAGHFCPDDIALMKNLPFFKVEVPFTLQQLKAALYSKKVGPQYIRLTANILEDEINQKQSIDSADIVVVSYGEMASVSHNVAVILNSESALRIGLILMNSLNDDALSSVSADLEGKSAIVIEDHISQGGLYSRLLENGAKIRGHINLPLYPDKVAVSRQCLLHDYGMNIESVVNFIKNLL